WSSDVCSSDLALFELQDSISDLYVGIQTLTKKHLSQSQDPKTPHSPRPNDPTPQDTQSSDLPPSSLSHRPSSSPSNQDSHSLKLPPLSLKTFNGSPERWLAYFKYLYT